MTRSLRLLAACGLVAVTAACQTTREQEVQIKPEVAQDFLTDKPLPLRKHFYVSLAQGNRNRVLNDMRLGLASLELGHAALAERLLDEALSSIETIYVDNADAEKARQLFSKELVKDFKGEPYERAMAYYYRGLLYLKAGDFDNARASFKAGFIQDSFADEDQNRADFGLLQYLQGWASRCRGNTPTAEEDFKDFKGINDKFPLPGKGDNTLVLIETGSAPVKYSAAETGEGRAQMLKYRRASATETARISYDEIIQPDLSASLAKVKGKAPPAPPPPARAITREIRPEMLEDIYFQASTRGGREFDTLLAGKAQFKNVTNTLGNAALIGALAASNVAMNSQRKREQESAAAAAGALLLVGLLAKGVAAATEAEADIRYWDNLPDRVHAATLALPPGVNSLSVDFLASDGTLLRTREVRVSHAGPCGLAWVRGDSALPANPRAPYTAPRETMYAPVIIPSVGSSGVLPGDKPKS